MENANKVQMNYKVDLLFFQKKDDFLIECKTTFHLQSSNVTTALAAAVMKLKVKVEDIEDAKIEREL